MKTYDKISEPIKIFYVFTENKIIYYQNKDKELKKFDAKKLKLNKSEESFVLDNINKVKIISKGFLWYDKKNDNDIFIGKDTIELYSSILVNDSIVKLITSLVKSPLRTKKTAQILK